MRDMVFYGFDGNAQLVGDLLVGPAVQRVEAEDLGVTRGQMAVFLVRAFLATRGN